MITLYEDGNDFKGTKLIQTPVSRKKNVYGLVTHLDDSSEE